VKEALKEEQKSLKKYDRVWVVFDKDDFKDFNKAITFAQKHKIQCVWSNESFELWYCLYFNYLNTGITRAQYITKIEESIQKATLKAKFKYKKNDPSFYPLLQKYGNEKKAIVYAEKLQKLYEGKNYAKHNPCTFVSDLVKELKNPESLNDIL